MNKLNRILAAAAMLCLTQPVFGQTAMYVDPDGRVGIGTDTPHPDSKLNIISESTGPVDAIFLENLTGPARINLQNLSITPSETKDPKWTINSNGDLRFTAGTDGAEMRLDAAGNLRVLNSITIDGIVVVPDYVFEPSFLLMPLGELKSYINEFGHLPEIPSASEIARDGLDMTDMQMRLLQKVEELTLYTLQQQETIELLQAKLNNME